MYHRRWDPCNPWYDFTPIAQRGVRVPLSVMKQELRIEASVTAHDDLIQRQIWDALNFAADTTGLPADDLMGLRAAAVSLVRQTLRRRAGHEHGRNSLRLVESLSEAVGLNDK